MFGKYGTNLIEDAIGGFKKIENQLNEGIELCIDQAAKNTEKITKMEQENKNLAQSCERAKKVLAHLQPFLGN